MTLFQCTLLFVAFIISFQVVPCFLTSSAIDLLQVVLGLPVFLVPCGFHSMACVLTLLVCFQRVCPIHVHFLLAISLLMLLVCPLPDFFVFGFILPFGFQDVSQTFVNECV